MNKFILEMVNKITVNNQDSNYTHSIFDISEYTGQQYSTLSDALNAIPQTKHKGGMTVRYVPTNDNKYIQARCMAQNFTTDVTQWQGVDEEPTNESKNLVESGGVAKNFNSIKEMTGGIFTPYLSLEQGNIDNTGEPISSNLRIRTSDYIQADSLIITTTSGHYYIYGYKEDGTYIGTSGLKKTSGKIRIPEAEKYKIVFKRLNGATIVPEDFSELGISVSGEFQSKFPSKDDLDETNNFLYGITDGLSYQISYPEAVKKEDDYWIRGSNGAITSHTPSGYIIIPCYGYRKIRFLGVVLNVSFGSNPGYSFGSYIEGIWTPSENCSKFMEDTSLPTTILKEYTIDIPDGATHFATTCKYSNGNDNILNADNFYIHLIKGNTIKQEISEEIDEAIHDIEAGAFATGQIVPECSLINEVTELNEDDKNIPTTKAFFKEIVNVLEFEQSSRYPSMQNLVLKKGVTYQITIKMMGLSSTDVLQYRGLDLFTYNSNNTLVDTLLPTLEAITGGYQGTVEYTPPKTVTTCRNKFTSAYSGNTIDVEIAYTFKTNVYFNQGDWNPSIMPLKGKKVVMFGDSLTQLPHTGTINPVGSGIVEYFAEYSGAEVIRAGVGGSHISSRNDMPSSVTSQATAKIVLDVVNLVDAWAKKDFTLQTDAIQYTDVYVTNIIEALTANPIEDVDVVTVFAGTNDSHGHATLGSNDSKDTKTFSGAINKIIETICSANPNISLFFFTPTPRWWESFDWYNAVYFSDLFDTSTDVASKSELGNLTSDNLWKIYRVTSAFTADSDFVKYNRSRATGDHWVLDDTGTEYAAGKYVAIINTSLFPSPDESSTPNYKYVVVGDTIYDLKSYAETMVNVSKVNHIPCCDLYWNLGWNQYNYLNYCDAGDGTHPVIGFPNIARRMYQFILSHFNQ